MVIRARGRQQVSLLRPDVANVTKKLDSKNKDRDDVATERPAIDLERSVRDIQRRFEEQQATAKETRRANLADIDDMVIVKVTTDDTDKVIRVPHGLKKRPKGFIVVYQSDYGTLRPRDSANLGDERALFFQADAAAGTVFHVVPR